MAHARNASPVKALVSVSLEGYQPVSFEVTPNALVANVKDVALLRLAIPLQHASQYALSLPSGKMLAVEFSRFQHADAEIGSSVSSKSVVHLKLVHTNPPITSSPPSKPQRSQTLRALPSASSASPPSRPRVASRITKLSSMFSGGSSPPSAPPKAPVATTISTSPGTSVSIHVSEIPIIEQPSLHSSSNSIEYTPSEDEVVEEIKFENFTTAALVDASDPGPNARKSSLPDLTRQSVSLDGDMIVALSNVSPPPTITRFSFYQQPQGSNRFSNMPVQINQATPEEQAQFDAMMAKFEAHKRKSALMFPGAPSPPRSPSPKVLTPRQSMMVPINVPQPTTRKPETANLTEQSQLTTLEAAPDPLESMKDLHIASPSLVKSTYTASVGSKRMPITKTLFPVRLATTQSAIGAAKPESVLCFRKTSEAIGAHVEATGRRNLDFIASPFAVGPFLRQGQTFEVVLLPAGPELIRTDIESNRWRAVCDADVTPATLMTAILLMSPAGTKHYVLRVCGTTEYLLDNERALVDYVRLRLLIRDRSRIVLLCEDRSGGRVSECLQNHERAYIAPGVPPTTMEPYYGLKTSEAESAGIGTMDGPVTLKIHALEHMKADALKEYMDLNDANWAYFKTTFESGGALSPDVGFSVWFGLVYNNEVIDGSEQRVAWKPSPMWVEQVRFPFSWSQIPRELRVLIRVQFRKSKSARPFVLGEACINLFDVFGALITGKHAVAISAPPSSPQHCYSTTQMTNTVYKPKHIPFLHYEIFELKSGLLVLHDSSPAKLLTLPKRSHASPIEFLLPERNDEAELSRLIRVHPLYRLNDAEKVLVWRFRYYLHFSSQHSLPMLVKCVDWMNPKMVDEMHRLISQWELLDPLLALLELLDADVSDTVCRTFAVDCLRQFSDEDLVTYMLQLTQALVRFETWHDSSLARFLLERSLRNRTQVGNAFFWNLKAIQGDGNILERVNTFSDAYLLASGLENVARFSSQLHVLQHFRTLSTRASKLDPKAKHALLESELQPDLFFQNDNEGDESLEPTSSNHANISQYSSHSSAANTGSKPTNSIQKGDKNAASTLPLPTSSTMPSTKILPQNSSSPTIIKSPKKAESGVTIGRSEEEQPKGWKRVASPSINAKNSAYISSSHSPSYLGSPDKMAVVASEPVLSSAGFEPIASKTFSFLNLPLDPSMCTRRIIKSKCKFMVSSAAPMWLVFDNVDPLAGPSPAIFKSGDDLRQDILILQMLNLMDEIWQRDGLELHVSAYRCVATGQGEGFIEVVQNSTTTGKIQKGFGASGAFRKTPLASWLQQQHSGNAAMHEEAIDNFVSSCAAYCVASYVLGLGDRHADNIMVTTMGNLFHIDFAHILGNIMMFGAYKRERAPFVLTPEFVFVMGDTKSKRYARLFKMMLSAGLPQFSDLGELAYLYKSLSLGLTEKAAADKFSKLIDESRKTTTTLVNNFFHNLATGAVGAAASGGATSASSSSSSSSSSKPQPRDASSSSTSPKKQSTSKSTIAIRTKQPKNVSSNSSPNAGKSTRKVK